MSVLDSFFILFESDASKLDKGLDETRRKAKEATKDVTKLDDAAGRLGGSLAGAFTQLAGAAMAAVSLAAMSGAMMDAVDQADALNESTSRLGLNIETVSAWGDLIKKNGGSVDGFIGSIESLNKSLSMMEVTGKSKAAPFLKELGIDLDNAANKGKTAMDFLPAIADAFEGMDKQKSVAMGQKLGFDQATIMTLQSGRREIEALLAKEKELGVITQKQADLADAFGDQLDDTRHAFRSLWLVVSESVLPALTWVSEKFQNLAIFMREHSDFIVGLMIALGAAITAFALPPLLSMAAAAVVAFAPFLVAGAIVTALGVAFALLYDDVMNFIDGNDSLIGQMLEAYPVIGDLVQGLVDVVKGLGDAVGWVFGTFVDVVQILGAHIAKTAGALSDMLGITELVGGIVSGLRAVFTAFGEVVGDVWDGLLRRVSMVFDVIRSGIALVKGVAGSISGALGEVKASYGIDGATAAAVQTGRAQLAAASTSPLTTQTSNSIANSRGGDRNVSVGQVTVHTAATDAAGISKSIGGALGAQMRQASANYDDGVAI